MVIRGTLYAVGGVLLITLIYVVIVLSSGLPTLEQLENPPQDFATQVFSSDGELLDHYAVKRRTQLPFDSIPRSFVNALIATEDRAFYDHWGLHVARIMKAAVKNVLSMRTKEGASTLTQQLALNLYFERERSIARKVREAWTALQIERTYTKHEILEMYANTVYYGRGAYGIGVAAQVYFNKPAIKLTDAESAYLVGLFKAPERYGSDDSLGISRRNLILGMMRDEGYLTEDRYQKAIVEPLAKPKPQMITRGIAPHFVEMIRQQLTSESERLGGYNLYRDGLIIHTTLNAELQKHLNAAVDEHLTTYQRMFNGRWSWRGQSTLLNALLDRAIAKKSEYVSASPTQRPAIAARFKRSQSFVDSVKQSVTTIQAGVVVLDPHTGAILAMVGASPQAMKLDPASRYSLNHATQIRRQPGSSFKPFVYASALEQGLSMDATIESGPFTYTTATGDIWSPRGTSKEGGPMPLRSALKLSINSVAARLITENTSPSKVVDLCQRLGITSPLHAVPSIALGSVEVTPLEMTAAYAAFDNQGVSVQPSAITRIEDRMGNVLYEARLPKVMNDALSPQLAQNMISLMRGVVDGGTASGIRRFFRHEAAGKTGTTNDFADAWFIGFTPQLVCGVWVGFDDRRIKFTGDEGQGGRAAAPIWGRFMQRAYADNGLSLTQYRFTSIIADSADTVNRDIMIDPPREESPTAEPPTEEVPKEQRP
jgi:penicillin-binding protein 1A